MKISVPQRLQLLALVVLSGALTTTVLVAGPTARAADPASPTGTFSAGPVSQMLTDIPGATPWAYVRIGATSLRDDTTAPADIVSTLDAGTNADGVGPTSARKIAPRTAAWFVQYRAAGTYTPKVTLKDADGNTTVVTLAPVTVTRDSTAPTVRVTAPRARESVRAWGSLRGTASDNQRAIWEVTAVVMQRRAGIWFVYDSDKRRWLRGSASEAATLANTGERYPAYTRTVVEGTWSLGTIRGLTKGLLVVRARASDEGGSTGTAPVLRQQLRRS